MKSFTTKLSPERQIIFCSYVDHVTAKGAGSYDRTIGYVFSFLCEVEDITKKGYNEYRKRHAAEIIQYKQGNALQDFMAYCGVQIGSLQKKVKAKALDKRVTLDKKAQEILNGFAIWIVKENAYTPNTVKGYLVGAKDFLTYTTTVTTETAQRYKASLEELNRAPRTINQRLNAVDCLARYLGKQIKIKRLKIPRTLSLENVPTEREVAKLLEYCKEHSEKVYIWIRLLSTTGARVHEFAKFTYEMVAAGHVDLKGKGNKIRRFFFSPKVQKSVPNMRKSMTSAALLHPTGLAVHALREVLPSSCAPWQRKLVSLLRNAIPMPSVTSSPRCISSGARPRT